MNGELGRIDGSLGVSIDKPNVELTAWRSGEIKAYGKERSKVEMLIEHFLSLIKSREKFSIHVEETIPEHVGFGSETQLSLAVAASIAKLLDLRLSTIELAQIMGRGGTSGIGVAAFETGGLILDGGHTYGKNREKEFFLPSNASRAPPAKVLARHEFPEDWGFILATPAVGKGAHGGRETEIFRACCPLPADEVGAISRIILMKLLPSLLDRDIETFGSGLSDLQNLGFARTAKHLMHPATARCIQAMRDAGAYGAGQSSFGPTAYGLIDQGGKKEETILAIKESLGELGGEVFFAGPNNTGAQVRYV